MQEFFQATHNFFVRRMIVASVVGMPGMLAAPGSALGQAQCDSTQTVRETELVGAGADYARLAELSGPGLATPRMARRLSNSMIAGCAVGPWTASVGYLRTMGSGLTVVPFSSLSTYNSGYPEDRNNGALWSGRGAAASVEGGAMLRLGRLSVGVLPTVSFQANQVYETLPSYPGYSPHANGLYPGMDTPQQFGTKSYSSFDAGQSYVRLDAGKFGLGVSNENVWWGPGFSNAILFTNTAPGFPHVFLNSRQPLNVGIGKLTGEMLWGRLSESKYFDSLKSNDHRMIVGALLSLEPKGVPGLFLGFGRTFVLPWDSVRFGNLFPFGQAYLKENLATAENPSGDNDDDQRLSIMARYVLPSSGFELFAEFAREDASWDAADLIGEPEHSSGRLLGFQKLFKPREARWIRTYAEVTNLQVLRQQRPTLRTTPAFYNHFPQGHTQRGQLLGASIGPGESQLLGMDFLGNTGLLGFYLERVRRDEFSARGVEAWSTTWPPKHDVALTGGVRFTKAFGSLRLDSEVSLSKRRNRNFIRDESNARLQLRMTWDGSIRTTRVPSPGLTASP